MPTKAGDHDDNADTDRLAQLYPATDVRASFEVNRASYHQLSVPACAPIDLRFDTLVDRMGIVNVAPTHGDLGIAQANVVTPGKPMESTLSLRMALTGPDGMPPLSHNTVQVDGLQLVRNGIENLAW